MDGWWRSRVQNRGGFGRFVLNFHPESWGEFDEKCLSFSNGWQQKHQLEVGGCHVDG